MNWPPDGTRDLAWLLGHPEMISTLPLARWEGTIAAARETSLLGTLWHLAELTGMSNGLPEEVARHLRGGRLVAERNAEAVRWELTELQKGLLQQLEAPILLKGAAYLAADLPNAAGRICNDIDLMFSMEEINKAESLLFYEGWTSSHHGEYDQRYYREWMHELPPLQHQRRGGTLDLHHNILPETFRVRVDPRRFLQQAVPAPGQWRYRMLCPSHLVIHCIAHLFSETEWDRGLRDLYDIHTLIMHFAASEGASFWNGLIDEAEVLGLGWMVERGLYCCRNLLDTPIPPRVLRRLQPHTASWVTRSAGRWLFRHGLNTRASSTPAQDAIGRGILFLRGHWLKMPPPLLLRHLFYKAFLAPKDDETLAQQENTEKHG